MLKKLKFGSSLAALVLFAFPWVDIQCSEKSMATQTGLQVIYGSGSPTEEMKDAGEESGPGSDESMGFAPLVALALVAVVGAVAFSAVSLFSGGTRAGMLASVLPAVALVLLLVQLMIGFPVKRQIIESMSEAPGESEVSDDGFGAAMGESIAAAMMAQFRVRVTPAFDLELVALGFPTLLLVNALIDKYKKEEGASASG